jgi:hypothetical protein
MDYRGPAILLVNDTPYEVAVDFTQPFQAPTNDETHDWGGQITGHGKEFLNVPVLGPPLTLSFPNGATAQIRIIGGIRDYPLPSPDDEPHHLYVAGTGTWPFKGD